MSDQHMYIYTIQRSRFVYRLRGRVDEATNGRSFTRILGDEAERFVNNFFLPVPLVFGMMSYVGNSPLDDYAAELVNERSINSS